MARKDYFVQGISTIVLAISIATVHGWKLTGASALAVIAVVTFLDGLFIGFLSVKNLRQAIAKCSLPCVFVIAGYFAFLFFTGMFGPGDYAYLIGVAIFAPLSILAGSIGARLGDWVDS